MAALNTGVFVPTTNVWDLAQLQEVDVNSEEFKELLVRLYQNINIIAQAVNLKESAYYATQEFVNGQSFFPDPTLNSNSGTTPVYRQVCRLVINFGALPNTATKTVAHNLTVTGGYTFTRIYGAASNTTGQTYLPLPYSSPVLANNIELSVNNVNVVVTTAANYSSYGTTYIILEYLKF